MVSFHIVAGTFGSSGGSGYFNTVPAAMLPDQVQVKVGNYINSEEFGQFEETDENHTSFWKFEVIATTNN